MAGIELFEINRNSTPGTLLANLLVKRLGWQALVFAIGETIIEAARFRNDHAALSLIGLLRQAHIAKPCPEGILEKDEVIREQEHEQFIAQLQRLYPILTEYQNAMAATRGWIIRAVGRAWGPDLTDENRGHFRFLCEAYAGKHEGRSWCVSKDEQRYILSQIRERTMDKLLFNRIALNLWLAEIDTPAPIHVLLRAAYKRNTA
jgi:hypothetical protein